MKRVAIYNRCSTEEDAQMNALETQVKESQEIAFRKGWEITAQYIESETGTTTKNRIQYQRMMKDMETDVFDILMIKSIDRLMRSTKDWYIFLDKMLNYEKRLFIYMDDKFHEPEKDALLSGIKAILAEDFSRELSRKIKHAHNRRQMMQSGLNITVPMFGWDKLKKDTYIINEEEAYYYRTAFSMAKEGYSIYAISKYMQEQGVRSKRTGKSISQTQWKKMLLSPRAHGTVILHQKEYDFYTKKTKYLPQEEWIYIENALPSIVTKEYQEEVIAIIQSREMERKINNLPLQMRGALSSGDDTKTQNLIRGNIPKTNRKETQDVSQENIKKITQKQTQKIVQKMTMQPNYRKIPLSQKIYCGCCNRVYYRITYHAGKTNELIEWKCSKKHLEGIKACKNINIMEEVIYEVVETIRSQYHTLFFSYSKNDWIEKVVKLLKSVINNQTFENEYKKLQKELEKYEQKKRILVNKWMDEIISDDMFQYANQELEEKVADLKKRIELQTQIGKREKGDSLFLNQKEFINLQEKGIKRNNESLFYESEKPKTDKEYIFSKKITEQRLQNIKEFLEKGDIIERAEAMELLSKVNKIVVHSNNQLEFFIPSQISNFNRDVSFLNSNPIEENKYSLQLWYPFHNEFDSMKLDDFKQTIYQKGEVPFFRIIVPYVHKDNKYRKREETKNKILTILKENPNFRIKDLFPLFDRKSTYIRTCIQQLKEEGKLIFDKNGVWTIIDKAL